MKFIKEEIKNRMKVSIVTVLTAAMAVLILAGCADNQQAQTQPPATETQIVTEPTAEPTTDPTAEPTEEPIVESTTEPVTEPIIEEPVGIPVTTPYMTFHYPEEWEGRVQVIQSDDGTNYTVTFKTEISGSEVVLFSLVLGPDDAEGYLLGQLNDENAGMINVYSIMNEVSPEEWSEEAYNEICSLQERVNDMIIQFFEDARFTPNR